MAHEHSHAVNNDNERKTLFVIIITLITMTMEITYGYITCSMALLADGYHMGTHAVALGLTYIAYLLIKKFKNSPHFPNGTDKIGTLTAYTSSLFLGFTGIWIIVEATQRLFLPKEIQYGEALLVAIIGLIVNTLSIIVMEYKGNKENHCSEEDYNFKAAYYHILADALTSILAISALVIGKYFGIFYLDPIIGILGGILILKWTAGLLKHTTKLLIDMK